jgi:hypothetical protein
MDIEIMIRGFIKDEGTHKYKQSQAAGADVRHTAGRVLLFS